jgi:hypothetical protein
MKYALVLAGLLLSHDARAQTADPATQELIQKLLTRVDTLEKRIAELEKGSAPSSPATSSPVVAQAPKPTSPAESEHANHDAVPQGEATAQQTYPSLKISGFSDFNFAASDLRGASGGFGAATLLNAHPGFQEGQFALHFSSALSPRVSFFGELSLTARPDAGIGSPAPAGAQLVPLLVVFKTPFEVPAYATAGLVGSAARAKTLVVPKAELAAPQVPP